MIYMLRSRPAEAEIAKAVTAGAALTVKVGINATAKVGIIARPP